MLHLLAAMRRRLPRWPRRRLTARVFDEAALALNAPEEEAAAAAASANAARRRRRRRRQWRWSGGLEALLAVARVAPLAAASCLACRADDEVDAAGRLHAAELGDLVVGEAMRFVIYL